jgi:hypothetical protein
LPLQLIGLLQLDKFF